MAFDNDRINQLERTVLELGTELFKVKGEVISLKDYHTNFVDIVDGLKKILDEKGLINTEDFEAAVELGDALTSTPLQYEYTPAAEIEKIKKTSH